MKHGKVCVIIIIGDKSYEITKSDKMTTWRDKVIVIFGIKLNRLLVRIYHLRSDFVVSCAII